MHPAEKVQAVLIAKKALDDASRDPDSDLSIMSRQFLRSEELVRVLAVALQGLLNLRKATEMSYEDAYHAMFKSDGQDAWNSALAALKSIQLATQQQQ